MSFMETAQLLGNLGEFVGAIAVVLTLFYLAVQVRHGGRSLDANTRSLDESRRLSMAQTYQFRTQLAQDAFLSHAESKHTARIAVKIDTEGWDSLTDEERWRYEKVQIATLNRMDNTPTP